MTSVQQIMVAKKWLGQLVMAPKSVTFQRHDHLVSVLFGDLLSHSYNITFSMFLDLVRICWYHMLASQLTCLGVAGTFAV